MKIRAKTIVAILLVWLLTLNLTSDYANASNTEEKLTNLPASLLVLSANGEPIKIYGNKNIDWTAIGLADKKLELTEYEKARLAANSLLDQLNPINRAMETCRDYRAIDQNTNPHATPNIYDFTFMCARIFYQYEHEYMMRAYEYDSKTATLHVAVQHGFLMEGNWTESPENYNLTEEFVQLIAARILQDKNLETKEINRKIPNKISFATMCQFLIDLAKIINPAPPASPLIYSDQPVIPIIIQPVPNSVDFYHDFIGTQWVILNNNRNETGYLSNNKPITQENVLELMNLIEQAFPSGTMWTSRKQQRESPSLANRTNNGYANPSTEMISLYLTQNNVSPKTACGGFASFVSDFIFGSNANPVRRTDENNIHPGDLQLNQYSYYDDIKTYGATQHTIVLTNVNNRTHMYDIADGNNGLMIHWDTWQEREFPKTRAVKNTTEAPEIDQTYYTRWPK